LTLHSSAPLLSNYTPTPWALFRGGKYKRQKNSIIIKKKRVSPVFMNGRGGGGGEKKKKRAPEEEVVWGLVHSFLLFPLSIRDGWTKG
jgi:hypothetical protein